MQQGSIGSVQRSADRTDTAILNQFSTSSNSSSSLLLQLTITLPSARDRHRNRTPNTLNLEDTLSTLRLRIEKTAREARDLS